MVMKKLIFLWFIIGAVFSFDTVYFLKKFTNTLDWFESDYSTCFVPDQMCSTAIADFIVNAKQSVDIQAYHLTNKEIIQAILDAAIINKVKVRIILDKAAKEEAYIFLVNKIPVYIDHTKSIAHNKVIIVDGEKIMTGSFNFTESAQHRNVENVLFVKNIMLAKKYENNFIERLSVSPNIVLHK